jgi:hypothetical protein
MTRRREQGGTAGAGSNRAGADTGKREAKLQKGPQAHAEGDHGEKTRQHILEQLQSRPPEQPVEERVARKRRSAAYEGKRRLVEDREQHDEAEKNSDRARAFVEHARGRDDGPSDVRPKLLGGLGHKGHRSDYKQRDSYGLRAKED